MTEKLLADRVQLQGDPALAPATHPCPSAPGDKLLSLCPALVPRDSFICGADINLLRLPPLAASDCVHPCLPSTCSLSFPSKGPLEMGLKPHHDALTILTGSIAFLFGNTEKTIYLAVDNILDMMKCI